MKENMKMQNLIIALVIALILPAIGHSQAGTVKESLSIDSDILQEKVKYSIYLPPDYHQSNRFYPIVYLLHGYTDDETAWLQFGEMNRIVDEAINTGSIPPMIIAMPDGGVNWYINNYNNEYRWEDMFIQEFLPSIESMYRVRRKKEFRGISGLSMGGYGSLVLAMHNPDTFQACAALSAGVWTDEEIMVIDTTAYDQYFKFIYGKRNSGGVNLTEHYKKNAPLHLVDSLSVEELSKVRYYLDCGDDDFLALGNSSLHMKLTKKKIPHEYRVRDGEHKWIYWRTGLPLGLQFIGESFRR